MAASSTTEFKETTSKIILLHGEMNAANYAKMCDDAKLDPKTLVYVFPGNVAIHDGPVGPDGRPVENSSPFFEKDEFESGRGLAEPVPAMGKAHCPTLSLATAGNDRVLLTQRHARRSVVDLWRLAGYVMVHDQFKMAIHVRDEAFVKKQGRTLDFPYLSLSPQDPSAEQKEKQFQVSFGGGSANPFGNAVARYYSDHLIVVIKMMRAGANSEAIVDLLREKDPELLKAFQDGMRGQPPEWFATNQWKATAAVALPKGSSSRLKVMVYKGPAPTVDERKQLEKAAPAPVAAVSTPVTSTIPRASQTTTTTTTTTMRGALGIVPRDELDYVGPPLARYILDFNNIKAKPANVKLVFLEGEVNPVNYAQACRGASLDPKKVVLIAAGRATPTQKTGPYQPKQGDAAVLNDSGFPSISLPTSDNMATVGPHILDGKIATHAIGDLWRMLGRALRGGETLSFAIPVKNGAIDLGTDTPYTAYYKAQLNVFINVCQAPLTVDTVLGVLDDNRFFLTTFLEGLIETEERKDWFSSPTTPSPAKAAAVPPPLEMKAAVSTGSEMKVVTLPPAIEAKSSSLYAGVSMDDMENPALLGSRGPALSRDSRLKLATVVPRILGTIGLADVSEAAIKEKISVLDRSNKSNTKLGEIKTWLTELVGQKNQFVGKGVGVTTRFFPERKAGKGFKTIDEPTSVGKMRNATSLQELVMIAFNASEEVNPKRHQLTKEFYQAIVLAVLNDDPVRSISPPAERLDGYEARLEMAEIVAGRAERRKNKLGNS